MTDVLAEAESYVEEDPATHLETRQRLERADGTLRLQGSGGWKFVQSHVIFVPWTEW